MEPILIYILAAVLLIIVIITIIAIVVVKKNKSQTNQSSPESDGGQIEVDPRAINTMVAYLEAQKREAEERAKLEALRKAKMKTELETFKLTKETLKDSLKRQFDAKEWLALDKVLHSVDKGGTGIYLIYNQTKNKYYVGQAKQLYKRVRDHFIIEQLALDKYAGDKIAVKFITANELDSDYRLDHIEKTGIEIFESDKTGYNRTKGNVQ